MVLISPGAKTALVAGDEDDANSVLNIRGSNKNFEDIIRLRKIKPQPECPKKINKILN
jgi:ABC-type hemin transport system substrate-binding protein